MIPSVGAAGHQRVPPWRHPVLPTSRNASPWGRFDGTAVPDRQPHRLSSPLKHLLLHFSKNITLSQHRSEKSVGGGTSCCLLPTFDIKQIKSALDSVASASHKPAAHRWGSRVASSICTLRQEPQMFGSSPTRVPQTGM